jgi:hypothetical protein|tara:strand:- start:2416 stop:3084 length:669 start_codon:yes stop_codon:yes gene_type:complete
MKYIQHLLILFLILTFLAGLYCTVNFNLPKEKMTNKKDNNTCPDLLIQKGNTILLYNTNQKLEDGINPLPFYNLDEYINYLEIQKQKGIVCPVLYLQQETTTQGDEVYRMRPSPLELEPGVQTMPAAKIPIHNSSNIYPGFDSHGQNQGIHTILDEIHDSTSNPNISDNPMDYNWGGNQYTKKVVESGKYKENEVTRPSLFNPKVSFNPDIQGVLPPPQDIL